MYLVVARIVAPQGRLGEVKAEAVTDFPERFASTSTVYVGRQPYQLEGHRFHGRVVVLKLRGIDSMDQARELVGKLVEVPEEEAVELPPDHYFWHQIIGLRVVTIDGEELGRVDDIIQTGANDVYIIHGPRGELLIPAIKQVVKSMNLDEGTITVELMAGLE